eukprot:362365-Rhodomonas_salina.4
MEGALSLKLRPKASSVPDPFRRKLPRTSTGLTLPGGLMSPMSLRNPFMMRFCGGPNTKVRNTIQTEIRTNSDVVGLVVALEEETRSNNWFRGSLMWRGGSSSTDVPQGTYFPSGHPQNLPDLHPRILGAKQGMSVLASHDA